MGTSTLPSSLTLQLKFDLRMGSGLFSRLPDILAGEFSFTRFGVIVDGALYDARPIVRETLNGLSRRFEAVVVHVYREQFEPTYDFLDRLRMEFSAEGRSRTECLIGIGGGSVLDAVKGLAVVLRNPGPALTYRGFPSRIMPPVPVVAVPSTAGTGSEIAYNAVFIEHAERKKLGINSRLNHPILSILDPELVAGAPRPVLVSSGLDVLVHALESFISMRANRITRLFSRQAFDGVMRWLPVVVGDPLDVVACAEMQVAAVLAMCALSNSSSGPAGALSYLLGCHFSVPHGLAGAVFIGRITRMNHQRGYHEYAELYGEAVDGDTGLSREEKSRQVCEAVEALLDRLGVPRTLQAFGAGPKDFELFFRTATESYKTAFDLNPVRFSDDEIRGLFADLLGIA